MPIHVTFTGETHEHVLAEINTFLAVTATPVSVQEVEPPAEEEKPKTRRGRKPGSKTITEETKTSRRHTKKEDKINPLLKDALKIAHQAADDITEGEDLVKEVLKEEFQKENLSDLTDTQLAEFTVILTEELNAPDPDGD